MQIDKPENHETPEQIAEWDERIKHFTDLWRPRKIEEAERKEKDRLARDSMREHRVIVEHGKRRSQGF